MGVRFKPINSCITMALETFFVRIYNWNELKWTLILISKWIVMKYGSMIQTNKLMGYCTQLMYYTGFRNFFARIYNWNELNDITKAQRPGSRKWEMTAAESNIAWKIDSPIQPSVPVMIYCLPSHVNVVCQLDSNQYTVHYRAKFYDE